MKKQFLYFFVSSTLLLFPFSNILSQSFLKKLAKGIENATKELDKVTDGLNGAKETTVNNTTITYSTPSKLLKIELDKVEMHGDDLYLEFILTNTSDIDIQSYALTSDFSKEHTKTYAVDNLGGRTTVVVVLAGTDPSRDRPSPRTRIPAGVPLRTVVKIGEINPKATSITQLTINGHDWSSSNKRQELNGNFVFKNIPIVRQQESTASISGSFLSTNSGVLNVPKTRGVMSLNDHYNKYDNEKRMTTAEQTSLKNKIKQLRNSQDFWFDGGLVKGKLIYKGEFGTLQTILSVIKDHGAEEYLLSYDTSGKLIDCIRIALISAYGGDRGEGFVEGNKVTIYSSAEGSSYSAIYKIEPTLKFIQLQDWQEVR